MNIILFFLGEYEYYTLIDIFLPNKENFVDIFMIGMVFCSL